jgi:rubredoxin
MGNKPEADKPKPVKTAEELPRLLNCPKCRLPLALYIEICPSCGVRIADLPSVDRPASK